MFSKAKLLSLSEEEAKTAKLYKRKGFVAFARDEARHSRFFKYLAKKKR